MAKERDKIDERLDLEIRRTIDARPSLIWKAWTDPAHLKKWWTPAPWSTVECQMDLRPGGVFSTVMRSPEGQDFPHAGCFLELVENKRLVFTNALEPGFRPASDLVGNNGQGAAAECAHITVTVILTLEGRGGKTDYHVRVLHKDEAGRKQHEAMGFHLGWNTALDQLIALVNQLQR